MLNLTETKKLFAVTASLVAAFGLSACQAPTATNGNANMTMNLNTTLNTNMSNMSMNSNASMANADMSNETSGMIDAGEPEQYQAKVSLKFQASGSQNMTTPPMVGQVARNGADRRIELTMPNGEKVIYLNLGGKQFVVAPVCKQYAELNKESLGFDIQSFMMPEQIVARVKNMKGVEKVGEGEFEGRDAVKYNYQAMTKTGTKAGDVQTDSVLVVDKETGLPLRSVINSQAQGGNVQGVNGLQLVTEISDIKTATDPTLFEEPTNLNKVAPEQIKQQVNAAFSIAMGLLGQLMKSVQPNAAAPMMTLTP